MTDHVHRAWPTVRSDFAGGRIVLAVYQRERERVAVEIRPEVARDLARQLERAADRAEGANGATTLPATRKPGR